jgi:hypothetical protein
MTAATMRYYFDLHDGDQIILPPSEPLPLFPVCATP